MMNGNLFKSTIQKEWTKLILERKLTKKPKKIVFQQIPEIA